jgi:hypothetical protein
MNDFSDRRGNETLADAGSGEENAGLPTLTRDQIEVLEKMGARFNMLESRLDGAMGSLKVFRSEVVDNTAREALNCRNTVRRVLEAFGINVPIEKAADFAELLTQLKAKVSAVEV